MRQLLVFLILTSSIQVSGLDAQPDSLRTMYQDLCWSPDGKHLYFSAMQVKPDFSNFKPDLWKVYRYSVKSKKLEVIATASLNVSVSHDGKWLAMTRNRDGGSVIVIADSKGKEQGIEIVNGTRSFAPSWSPDGNRIVFNTRTEDKVDIYSWQRNDGTITQLTEGEHSYYNPAWSPDGSKITYYLEKGDGMDQVYLINPDGSNTQQVTNDHFNNIYPGWIDNSTLIYGQGEKNSTRLTKVDLRHRQVTQVYDIESFYGRFSNNGQYLAYADNKSGTILIRSTDDREIMAKIRLDQSNSR